MVAHRRAMSKRTEDKLRQLSFGLNILVMPFGERSAKIHREKVGPAVN